MNFPDNNPDRYRLLGQILDDILKNNANSGMDIEYLGFARKMESLIDDLVSTGYAKKSVDKYKVTLYNIPMHLDITINEYEDEETDKSTIKSVVSHSLAGYKIDDVDEKGNHIKKEFINQNFDLIDYNLTTIIKDDDNDDGYVEKEFDISITFTASLDIDAYNPDQAFRKAKAIVLSKLDMLDIKYEKAETVKL